MTAIPLVDLAALHAPLTAELHEALDRVLATSGFTGGDEVEAFEAAFAARVGVPHAVGVASGTAALSLALAAWGIGPGDEVILPPNTFVATAGSVVAVGATPVLADVDPDTALLDPDAAAAAVSSRTAAIVPVHLYGQPIDPSPLRGLAARHGLALLEDACQALGGSWRGRPTGSLADAAAFSLYPTKNLGALGDGGVVTTADPALARRVRLLRSHGERSKGVHEAWGACERLDGLQAAFLRVKLAGLERALRDRARVAGRYEDALADVADVRLLHTRSDAVHAHHLFVVRVPERDAVLRALRHAGIGAAVHYPVPIHLQPAAVGLGARGGFPVAEALAASVLSLPLWPGMPDADVDRVVDALCDAVRDVVGADGAHDGTAAASARRPVTTGTNGGRP